MRTLVCLLSVLAIATAANGANLVVNGDFSDGETGWTEWASPWGIGDSIVEDGMVKITGQGSRGYVQPIATTPGQDYTITADWAANGQLHWGEVLFFNDDGRAIYDQLDQPNNSSVIVKVDGWGMNGGATVGFPSLVPAMSGDYWYPAGIFTNTVKATGNLMWVSLKGGASDQGGAIQYFADNVVVTPEPVTALLLGLSLVLVRRHRA